MNTKAKFRPAHSREVILYTVAGTSAGEALIASSERGIVALAFLGAKSEKAALADLRLNLGDAGFERDDRALGSAVRAARNFLAKGDAARDEVAMDLRGTDFQKRVWKELLRIPRGKSVTYSDIARRIGKPLAVRAVASAIGDNPVSLLVPCHRVLRKDGSLGGFRWGLKIKSALLEIESDCVTASGRSTARKLVIA